MKKLRLKLDELRVDTFDAGAGGGAGTVRARQLSDWLHPCDSEPFEDSINYCGTAVASCAGQYTCNYTCGNTCSCGCGGTGYGQYTCNGPNGGCTEPVLPEY